MTNNTIVRLLIIAGVFALLLYILSRSSEALFKEATRNDLPETFVIPREDMSFFLPAYRERIRPIVTFNSKVRYPIEVMNVLGKIVYRFSYKTDSHFKLEERFHIDSGKVAKADSVYLMLYKDEYNMEALKGPMTYIKEVYLTSTAGKVKKYFASDTIIAYKLDPPTFSIRFDQSASADIFGSKTRLNTGAVTPLDIVLWKAGEKLLLFIKKPDNGINSDFSLIDVLNLK